MSLCADKRAKLQAALETVEGLTTGLDTAVGEKKRLEVEIEECREKLGVPEPGSVLVPMLPGHGFMPSTDDDEDLSAVPTADTWARDYGGLAARMNRILALSPGERVIIGYSLGGTIAINAALRGVVAAL